MNSHKPEPETEEDMILAEAMIARSPSRLAAYNHLQVRLMTRWVAKGRSEQEWIDRMACVFARRYGWILSR